MPGPWSSMVRVPSASRTVIVPSAGLHLAALSSRLVTARSIAPDSPTTHHGVVTTSKWMRGARRRTRSTARSTTSARSKVSTTGRAARRGRARPGRRRGSMSSSSWARTSSSSSARASAGQPAGGVGLGQQVEVGAQRGQRGAQLVAGVGDQAALAVTGGGERREHRVERRGQPGDLVVALDRDRRRAARCGRSPRRQTVSRRTGRSPLRATAQPASPAAITPSEPEERAAPAEPASARSPGGPATGRAPAPARSLSGTAATR